MAAEGDALAADVVAPGVVAEVDTLAADVDTPGVAVDFGAPGVAVDLDAPGAADEVDAPGAADNVDAPGAADGVDAPGAKDEVDAPSDAIDGPPSFLPALARGMSLGGLMGGAGSTAHGPVSRGPSSSPGNKTRQSARGSEGRAP